MPCIFCFGPKNALKLTDNLKQKGQRPKLPLIYWIWLKMLLVYRISNYMLHPCLKIQPTYKIQLELNNKTPHLFTFRVFNKVYLLFVSSYYRNYKYNLWWTPEPLKFTKLTHARFENCKRIQQFYSKIRELKFNCTAEIKFYAKNWEIH